MRGGDEPEKPQPRKVRQRAPGAGRPRKPQSLHVLEGTRSRAPGAAASPATGAAAPPPVAELVAPEWICDLRDGGLAEEFFYRVGRGLIRLGWLGALDVDALAILAETYSVYRRAAASIPLRITTPKTGRTPLQYGLRGRTLRELHMGMAQFGLSPVARTKIIGGDEVPVPPTGGAAPQDRAAGWMGKHGGTTA